MIPKGTLVTCPQCGAAICTTAKDLKPGEPFGAASLGDWIQAEPRIGQMGPIRCRNCDAGAIYLQSPAGPLVHFFRLGWQPKTPEAARAGA